MVPVRLYAAFPASDFGGNVAGIVYDDVGLDDGQMQGIAAQLGAPTTGFVAREDDLRFRVRFFSSEREMDMCGHVTVAVFIALLDDGRIRADGKGFRQLTPAGEISVALREGPEGPSATMKQHPPEFDLFDVPAREIARLLGLAPSDLRSIGSAATALKHLCVELPDKRALAAIRPDDAALRAFTRSEGIDTIGVWTALGQDAGRAQLRVRDLCHGVGDPEEAASGTTNGALACHLWRSGRALPNTTGTIAVEAEQGFEMGRPSLISTELELRDDVIAEVRVGGRATRRLTGEFHL